MRFRWLLVLASFLMAGLFAVRAFLSPAFFTANALIHPETNGGAEAGGISIPDPMSLLLGGGMTSDDGEQMIGVLKSRHISEAVMHDSVEWEGQQHLVADLVIDHLPKSFSPVGWAVNLLFPPDSLPTAEDKAIMTAKMMRENMLVEATEEGFISFSLGYYHAGLLQLVANGHLEELEEYYLKQKTAKAQRNVVFFTERADSVKRELDKATYTRARIVDQQQYRIFAQDQVYNYELDAQMELLKEMYITLVTSRESAIAQLKRETPMIQVLDPPRPPYDVQKSSFVVMGLLGGFLGLFLLSIWLTRRLWREDVQNMVAQFIAASSRTDYEDQ